MVHETSTPSPIKILFFKLNPSSFEIQLSILTH
jgi:hypothetical protein